MEKQKCLIYCRVSTVKQEHEGDGLNSQENRCQKYAEDKGYTVVNIFRDTFTGGGDFFKRPAMKELLEYLDENPFTNFVVVFDDLKRFARDTASHWKLRKALDSRSASPECLNYKFDDTPEGEFIETILAAQGELERKQNQRQVMQKMKARMENGYWCLCPPTGMVFKKTSEHGKLLFSKEPEASVIKEALEGYARGRLASQVDVQRFLQTKSHLLWKATVHLEFVKRILTEILYTGYIEYPKWGVRRHEGKHKGFISIETFNVIEAKLAKPEKKVHTTDTVQFPLRRLVECRVCGKKFTGSRNKGKTKYYSNYTCNNKQCAAKPKNIQKHILEADYLNVLKQIAPEKELLELTKQIALDAWDNSMQELNSHKEKTQRLIKQKEGEVDQCLDLILKTTNDTARQQYEDKMEDLTKEIKKLESARPITEDLHFDEALTEVLDFIGTPHKYWEQADIEGKHLVHRLVFPQKPRYDMQKKFGTPEVSLPFRLNEFSDVLHTSLVEMPGVEPGCKDLK